MKRNLFLLIALAVAGLSGCGQNPLEGYDARYQNGLKPEDRPQKPDLTPICKECFRIVVNDGNPANFFEGEEGQARVFLAIFKPYKDFSLEIANSGVFEGARLEIESESKTEKNYILKWKPPEGFTRNQRERTEPIQLRLIVGGDQKLSQDESALIRVNRQFKVPKIKSMDFDSYEISEGQIATLKFVVEDRDSDSQNPPRVKFVKPTFGSNGAGYLELVDTKELQNKEWEIIYEMDLTNKEVTKDYVSLYATAIAVSQYDVSSVSDYTSIRVNNLLRKPKTTVPSFGTYTFTRGAMNSVTLSAYDSSQEGRVGATLKTSTASWPGSPTLNCVPEESYLVNCRFNWNVPLTTPMASTYTVEIEAENRSGSGWGSKVETTTVTLKINIPAASTTTTTTTTTTLKPTDTDGGVQ